MDEVQQPQTAPDGAPRVLDVAGLDLADTATWQPGMPHAQLDILRAKAPVAWQDEAVVEHRSSELNSGIPAPYSPGYWAVTSHALVEEASKHPELYSSALGGVQLHSTDEITLAGLRLMMLAMDPPHQLRLRKIVSPSFNPRSVNALADYVTEQSVRIAAELAGAGTVDFVDVVSKELTTLVLAKILGIPESDRHLIVRWSDALIGFEAAEQSGDMDTTFAMHMELLEYGRSVCTARRANPTDDLMSQIANAEVDGDRLTEDEFCFFWLLLIIAGNETTRNSLSGAVIALLEHDKWRDLGADAAPLTGPCVEELIRYVTPVIQFRRTATRDVVLGEQAIRAGDKVVLYYTAANRDPAVFADPHQLDLTRDPNPHLAFGIGPHFCLGTRLARLQIATMLKELATRYPKLALDGDVQRIKSTFIAGVDHLPIRVG